MCFEEENIKNRKDRENFGNYVCGICHCFPEDLVSIGNEGCELWDLISLSILYGKILHKLRGKMTKKNSQQDYKRLKS